MDTTALDSNTITLMVTIAGSWLTLVGLIFYQSNRLDTKIDQKFDALSRDVADVGVRVARVEGHLMGPESFGMRDPSSTAPGEHSSEDPDPDRRQAD